MGTNSCEQYAHQESEKHLHKPADQAKRYENIKAT